MLARQMEDLNTEKKYQLQQPELIGFHEAVVNRSHSLKQGLQFMYYSMYHIINQTLRGYNLNGLYPLLPAYIIHILLQENNKTHPTCKLYYLCQY